MHILILSQYFPPETGSAAAKVAELAHFLTEDKHSVSVICQIPNYPSGVVYRGYEHSWFCQEEKNGLDITRTWSFASQERGRFLPRLLNYVTFMLSSLWGLAATSRPDIILVYSPPLFLGLSASLASRRWGSPFVFWVNDLWPRAALFLGFMRPGLLYRLACAMERFIYKHAASIMVYSKRMAEEVVADGGDPTKIDYHPLWVDTNVFHPDAPGAAEVRQKHGWEDKFIILYGGNLGLAQGLDVFLESARLLQAIANLHFVLVGSGVEKEKLIQRAQDQGLSNVEFIGHQPKESVCSYFSAADVLFAHLKAAPHRVGTVPEKILAYMACGRPVLLAAQEGAAADLIREHGCGQTVPPDNPEALAQAIRSLYQRNSDELDQMGFLGRQAAIDHFSMPKVLREMVERLSEIAKSY